MADCKVSLGLACPNCNDIRTKAGLFKEFYLINVADLDTTTGFQGFSLTEGDSDAFYVSAINMTAYTYAYKFCAKDQSLRVLHEILNTEGGYKSWTETFTGRFLPTDYVSRSIYDTLVGGTFIVVVRDFNSRFWILGFADGLEMTAGQLDSGAAFGDVSGMTFTLSAGVDQLPYQLLIGSGYADTYSYLEGLLAA